jgi:hypothetical protein
LRARIETADRGSPPEALAQDPRDDAGPAPQIEDSVRRSDGTRAFDEIARLAVEDARDQDPLERVGEVRQAECVFHTPVA